MSITRGSARISLSRIGILAFLLLFLSLNSVQAVTIWSPTSSGTGDGLIWMNGQGSDKNLFGSPTITPTPTTSNTFSFSPSSSFVANSSGGKTTSVSDSLQFEIEAESEIQSIHFAESGNYGISGTGSVEAICTITIQNLDVYQTTPLIVKFDVFKTNVAAASSGWSGDFGVDYVGWSHIRITMNNRLTARTGSGSNSSWINKNIVGVNNNIGISIMIPEPATVGILAMGSLTISIFGRKKS